jgi:hypothetical protein
MLAQFQGPPLFSESFGAPPCGGTPGTTIQPRQPWLPSALLVLRGTGIVGFSASPSTLAQDFFARLLGQNLSIGRHTTYGCSRTLFFRPEKAAGARLRGPGLPKRGGPARVWRRSNLGCPSRHPVLLCSASRGLIPGYRGSCVRWTGLSGEPSIPELGVFRCFVRERRKRWPARRDGALARKRPVGR